MKIPIPILRIARGCSKHSDAILTAFNVGGVVLTTLLGMEARSKADILMADLRDKHYPDEPPAKEVIKTVGPVYIPTIVSGGLTIGCAIGQNRISHKKKMALASLYTASEVAMKEYQAKVIEMIGEKKEQKVRDEIAKDHAARTPMVNNQVIITGKGDNLILDDWSGRFFKSDIEKIRRVENDVNKYIISNMWITLNEVYYDLGLEPIKLGNTVGWNVDRMLHFRFSSQIAPNGEPCLVVSFEQPPVPYNSAF